MRTKGFTLIELLIVVAIIAILAAIAVPNFLEAQTRSKVARAQSDMRALATAIETYYLDNNTYPAATLTNAGFTRSADQLGGVTANPSDAGVTFRLRATLPTGAVPANNQFQTLTTPVAFLSSYPSDVFANSRGLPFRYFTDGRRGFILGSFGPNSNQGAGGNMGWSTQGGMSQNALTQPNTWGGIKSIYLPAQSQPSPFLLAGRGGQSAFDPAFGGGTPPTGYTAPGGTASFTYDPTNGTVSQGDVWRVKN